MKAMIFAAGLGTRLKPFTLSHPKALVPVAGKPMLQHVIENIAAAGITEIVVNVHHFATQIIDFLRGNNDFGLDIAVSDESGMLLDTGGGLLHARPLLEKGLSEPVLLHNADIWTDCPLGMMIEAFSRTRNDVMLLCSHRQSSRTLYFDKDSDSLLGWENLATGECRPQGFTPPLSSDSSPFGGIHIVSPSIFPILEKYAGNTVRPFSIIPFYLDNIDQLKIHRFLLPDGFRWFDVGSAGKLSEVERRLSV